MSLLPWFLTAAACAPDVRAADDAASDARKFSVATHIRVAEPRVGIEVDSENDDEHGGGFGARGVAQPGVDIVYGRFGVSLSGAFLTNPADRILTAGFRREQGVRDLRTRYHGDIWGMEFHHLAADGPGDYASSGNPEEMRSDIGLRATSLTVYRSVDPDSRVYRLSEGMREFGANADVFLVAGASDMRLSASSALLPNLSSRESRFHGVDRVGVTSLQFGGGYLITTNLGGLYFDNALFAGWGPQYQTWGSRSAWTFNLARANLRLALGIRNRWFDVGVGVENEAYTSFDGADRMQLHAVAMQAKLAVFL